LERKKIPIKNEKLRVSILAAQETNFELERAENFDSKMSAYDKLFMAYNDALRIIREETAGSISSGKSKSQKAETQEENLQSLMSYISYMKLCRTIDRNMLLIDSLEKRIVSRHYPDQLDFVNESSDGPKKKSRPDDLVRVYETLVQNVSELLELQAATDAEQTKEINAKFLSFKALRCYYMGLSYSYASKWKEALALFDRAAERVKVAISHHEACKNLSQEFISKLREIDSRIRGHKCEAHAKAFVESLQPTNSANKEITEVQEKVQSSLLTGLNSINYNFSVHKELVPFPPDFEAIKCKPLLFDLALNECEFPSLESRKKSKSGFWNFWGR